MEEFKTVLKIFGLSLLVIVLMQLKISNDTIENHFESWIQTSSVAGYLQHVADGAVKLGNAGISVVTEYTHDKFNIPAHLRSPVKKSHELRAAASKARAAAISDEDDDSQDEIE